MKHFFLTYVGFFIFVATFLLTEHHASTQVSSHTPLQNYREMFAVKQGHSSNGNILITQSLEVINVPNNAKVPNHLRNLRVFTSFDNMRIPVLYLEQSKPHAFYSIQGPFLISFNKKVLKWTDPTTFTFSATGTDNVYRKFSVNVHTLSSTSSPVGVNTIAQNLTDVTTDVQ